RRYLESLNIPSKDDVARVVGQVIQAEEKISRLEQELYRLKDIEAKLDALLGNHEEASASRTTPKTGARTTSKTGSRPRARAKDEAPRGIR
ncbi:MAG TPA: hypothetical protein VHS59_13555, partial [Bacillota bacterium]|nr:hypothetical protein [Bacillota bacterium]